MTAPVIKPSQYVLQAFFLTDRNGNPLNSGSYEAVAASQTDQVMGGAGAIGDVLAQMTVTPASTSPGAISIKDGSGGSLTVFAGGANSVVDLKPFTIVLGLTSALGAWKVTTGANVSLLASGSFT